MGAPADNARASRADLPGSARTLVGRVGTVALWVAVWQLASMVVGSHILLAGPLDTIARLAQLLGDARFGETVAFSLVRIAGGFVLAYGAAVVLALVAQRWPIVGRLVEPAVAALKSIPIACVIVLLLIWVGSRRVSGIAVFLAVFPAVYYACAEGLRQVDAKVDEMLRCFGVRGLVRLCAHVWPSLMPYLVGTSKNVCGMAWKAGVAAELIGSPMGSIGERIYQSKILLETADLFAWTIVVVALSAVCERVFVALLAGSGTVSQRLALWLATLPAGDAAGRGEADAPAGFVLNDATIGYDGVEVARGLNLSLAPGSRTVLTDASGTGKTTLLRTLAGLLPLRAGAASPQVTVSMVFQEARLIERMTAVQNVLLVVGGLTREEAIRDALAELLPGEVLDRPVSELSGGQRRRVEVVRALLYPSSAVLLDEPFASLDQDAHRAAAAFVLRRLSGRTLLVASHAPGDAQLLSADELSLFPG